MAIKYKGNIITDVAATHADGYNAAAKGIWGMGEIHQAQGASTWPYTALPSGGTKTNPSGTTYLHVFNSTDDFVNVTAGLSVEYLVIAGGASGGSTWAGGGGAGGYRTNFASENTGGGASGEGSLTMGAVTYECTVGAGGTARTLAIQGDDGHASSIVGSDITDITTVGGGGGGIYINPNPSALDDGRNGGSGGGGGQHGTGGTGGEGTSGQGYDGGNGYDGGGHTTNALGGGGGAGGVGENGASANAGDGGAGLTGAITGTPTARGGGGGGHAGTNAPGGEATAGGGSFIQGPGGSPLDGSPNTGGGGAGHGSHSGAGGSGVVIIKYTL